METRATYSNERERQICLVGQMRTGVDGVTGR